MKHQASRVQDEGFLVSGAFKITINSKSTFRSSLGVDLFNRLSGDSGYPLMTWLLTLLTNIQTSREYRYNNAHCCTQRRLDRRVYCADKVSCIVLSVASCTVWCKWCEMIDPWSGRICLAALHFNSTFMFHGLTCFFGDLHCGFLSPPH